MTSAIVYTRPGCNACRITANRLDFGGVNVDLRDIDDHPDVVAMMEYEDRRMLPYVEIYRDDARIHRWDGLRMSHINDTIEGARGN